MSEITHADYMSLVERIEKLEAFMKRELSRQAISARHTLWEGNDDE